MYGVSQPTISRVKRGMVPLLDQVVCLHEPDPKLVFKNRIVLVDGSDAPTGNRKNTGKDNYSGKRHRQGLNIQVAASPDGALLAVPVSVQGARQDRRALTRDRLGGPAGEPTTSGWLTRLTRAPMRPPREGGPRPAT